MLTLFKISGKTEIRYCIIKPYLDTIESGVKKMSGKLAGWAF